MKKCIIDGCDKPTRTNGQDHCGMHYHRFYRYGTYERYMVPQETYVHSHGYILKRAVGHWLTRNGSSNYEYEHRIIFFDCNGEGPFKCNWCQKTVCWETMHIDHLDDNKKNNNLSNLVPSCPTCNKNRGSWKISKKWRAKTGVEWNGKIYSWQELADIKGISRFALLQRVKKMSLDEAMSLPRGNTGPKSKNVI